MGMFDTVTIFCPKCGTGQDTQTKTGACILGNYTIGTTPLDVLAGLNGRFFDCTNCDYCMQVVVQHMVHVE